MIEKAVADGYNVIVMPGYAFANAIKQTVNTYTDVKFVALDVGAGDLNTLNDDGSIKEEFKVPSNPLLRSLPGRAVRLHGRLRSS